VFREAHNGGPHESLVEHGDDAETFSRDCSSRRLLFAVGRHYWPSSALLRTFALGAVSIGSHSNPLGEVWYWYIVSGDNTYSKVGPGVLAGAVEDTFLLGPLYLATGVGLLKRSAWAVPVGVITGAMIVYAIVGFFLGDICAGLPTVTNSASYWATNLPYLAYPL
jgi:hypothetical protein